MARPKMKTNTKRLSLSLEGEAYDALEELARESKMSRTAYLENLLMTAHGQNKKINLSLRAAQLLDSQSREISQRTWRKPK